MFEFFFKYSPWAYRAGELSFSSSRPVWGLSALAIAGALLIGLSLLRRRHLSVVRRAVLGVLQAAMLAVILVMLWRPVLLVERVKDRENVVAVVMDASASMAHGEGADSRLQQSVKALAGGPLEAFRKSFGVRLFSFASAVQSLKQLTDVPPPGTQTRIGDALYSVMQTGSTAPLSGIVVITDGAENGASLSEERLAELASFGVPVHTVGVGPDKNINDLELDSVSLPQNATPGEVLIANVSIRHDAKARTRLRVYDGEQLLAADDVELSADAGITTHPIVLLAGEPGVRDLRFTLDPLPDERNTINNTRTQVIDVAPRKGNILYIEGEPRWEYKFIRRAAETDTSLLRIASLVRATPNRYYRQGIESPSELEKGFPQKAEELFAFDAVIIGSFEASALSTEQHQMLKDFVDRRGGGLLMLAGRDGLSDGGWQHVPVAQTLPARLPEGAKTFTLTAGKARLTAYGTESPITHLENDPVKNVKAWNEMPPFADLQALGQLKPGAVVLLDAVTAANRAQPLLVWQHYGRGTTYLLGTASTWRWKMRLPHEDQRHYTFWRQLLHAVADAAPPRLSLTTAQKVYNDERKVVVSAELHNDKFEPLNDAAVELTMTSDDGVTSARPMVPSGQSDGRYTATVQASSAGLYRLTMRAKNGTKDVGTLQTHFRRNDGVVEHFGTQQNRPLLQRIADSTGGRYWRLDQLDDIPDAMRYSKAGIVERQTLDLWNLPALFLLLLALKATEWLLRLRWKTL